MSGYVLTGATVIDGTGAPRFTADVSLDGGVITGIGRSSPAGSERIDADGLVVAPGFVDPHVHYDAQIMWDPAVTPSTMHGVTTIVGGNCGFGVAPLGGSNADYVLRLLANVEGMSIDALRAGSDWAWDGFDEWLDHLAGGLAVNASFLIGHSTVRRYVMGEHAATSGATDEQIAAMVAVVEEALRAGAVGFSTSMNENHHDGDGAGVPSRRSDRRELFALARAMRAFDDRVLEIVPAMSAPFDETMYEFLAELALASKSTVLWNSLAVDAARPEWHERMLKAAPFAAARGGRVVALSIPDVARLRLSFSNGMILQAFAGWADLFAMPHAERRRALSDPMWRERLVDGLRSTRAGGLFARFVDFGPMRIGEATAPRNLRWNGSTVAYLASATGKDPFDAALDLAIDEDLMVGFWPVPAGDDDASWSLRAAIWQQPDVLVGGGDAGAHLDAVDSFNYPAVLAGPVVRDRRLLDLETAVRLLTSEPARMFGLRGRGVLEVGAPADLVVFDANTFGPGPIELRADLPGGARRLYAEAEGLHHVFVNGVPIVLERAATGATPGRVLRS